MATRPDAEPGDHVHGERGEEGDAQRPHGGRAHPFGGRLHLAPALRLAPEGAQGGQPLDQLEEARRPARRAGATGARRARRLAPEVDHRDGHGEHERDHDDEGRASPGCATQTSSRTGIDGGRRGLGQVARVVGVQRAQPPRRGQRELARSARRPASPARGRARGAAARGAGGPPRVRRARAARVAHRVQQRPARPAPRRRAPARRSRRRAARGGAASGRRRRPAPRPGRRWPPRSARPPPGRPRRPGAGPAPVRPAPGRPGAAGSGRAGGGVHSPKCRVLHLDRPADEALGDSEAGGLCIFAGGGRADPIGQVGHDGRALRLEAVGAAVGDGVAGDGRRRLLGGGVSTTGTHLGGGDGASAARSASNGAVVAAAWPTTRPGPAWTACPTRWSPGRVRPAPRAGVGRASTTDCST